MDSIKREIKRIRGVDWDTIPKQKINKSSKSGSNRGYGDYNVSS